MAYVHMMGVAGFSYCLAYGRSIVADYIFWFVPDFVYYLFQHIFDGRCVPAFCNGNIHNGYVFFRNCRTGIVGRDGECEQKLLTANHHAFIHNQSISLVFEQVARFLVYAKPQFLRPIANCCIGWDFTENVAHKLVQDVEYLNYLA